MRNTLSVLCVVLLAASIFGCASAPQITDSDCVARVINMSPDPAELQVGNVFIQLAPGEDRPAVKLASMPMRDELGRIVSYVPAAPTLCDTARGQTMYSYADPKIKHRAIYVIVKEEPPPKVELPPLYIVRRPSTGAFLLENSF